VVVFGYIKIQGMETSTKYLLDLMLKQIILLKIVFQLKGGILQTPLISFL
jgi:hypothetical protein